MEDPGPVFLPFTAPAGPSPTSSASTLPPRPPLAATLSAERAARLRMPEQRTRPRTDGEARVALRIDYLRATSGGPHSREWPALVRAARTSAAHALRLGAPHPSGAGAHAAWCVPVPGAVAHPPRARPADRPFRLAETEAEWLAWEASLEAAPASPVLPKLAQVPKLRMNVHEKVERWRGLLVAGSQVLPGAATPPRSLSPQSPEERMQQSPLDAVSQQHPVAGPSTPRKSASAGAFLPNSHLPDFAPIHKIHDLSSSAAPVPSFPAHLARSTPLPSTARRMRALPSRGTQHSRVSGLSSPPETPAKRAVADPYADDPFAGADADAPEPVPADPYADSVGTVEAEEHGHLEVVLPSSPSPATPPRKRARPLTPPTDASAGPRAKRVKYALLDAGGGQAGDGDSLPVAAAAPSMGPPPAPTAGSAPRDPWTSGGSIPGLAPTPGAPAPAAPAPAQLGPWASAGSIPGLAPTQASAAAPDSAAPAAPQVSFGDAHITDASPLTPPRSRDTDSPVPPASAPPHDPPARTAVPATPAAGAQTPPREKRLPTLTELLASSAASKGKAKRKARDIVSPARPLRAPAFAPSQPAPPLSVIPEVGAVPKVLAVAALAPTLPDALAAGAVLSEQETAEAVPTSSPYEILRLPAPPQFTQDPGLFAPPDASVLGAPRLPVPAAAPSAAGADASGHSLSDASPAFGPSEHASYPPAEGQPRPSTSAGSWAWPAGTSVDANAEHQADASFSQVPGLLAPPLASVLGARPPSPGSRPAPLAAPAGWSASGASDGLGFSQAPDLFAPGDVSILGARADTPARSPPAPLAGLKHAAMPGSADPFLGGARSPSPSPMIAPHASRSFAALSASQPGSAETSFDSGLGLGLGLGGGGGGADDSQERRARAAAFGGSQGADFYCSQYAGHADAVAADVSALMDEDIGDYDAGPGGALNPYDADAYADELAPAHLGGSSQEVLREVTTGGSWYS